MPLQPRPWEDQSLSKNERGRLLKEYMDSIHPERSKPAAMKLRFLVKSKYESAFKPGVVTVELESQDREKDSLESHFNYPINLPLSKADAAGVVVGQVYEFHAK